MAPTDARDAGQIGDPSPGMKTPLETLGMVGLGDKSLQQFDDFVTSETVRWAQVITEAELAGTQ